MRHAKHDRAEVLNSITPPVATHSFAQHITERQCALTAFSSLSDILWVGPSFDGHIQRVFRISLSTEKDFAVEYLRLLRSVRTIRAAFVISNPRRSSQMCDWSISSKTRVLGQQRLRLLSGRGDA